MSAVAVGRDDGVARGLQQRVGENGFVHDGSLSRRRWSRLRLPTQLLPSSCRSRCSEAEFSRAKPALKSREHAVLSTQFRDYPRAVRRSRRCATQLQPSGCAASSGVISLELRLVGICGRNVVQDRRQPAFGFRNRPALARRIVLDLVELDLADAEILGFLGG